MSQVQCIGEVRPAFKLVRRAQQSQRVAGLQIRQTEQVWPDLGELHDVRFHKACAGTCSERVRHDRVVHPIAAEVRLIKRAPAVIVLHAVHRRA